jgi:hypothetical protein
VRDELDIELVGSDGAMAAWFIAQHGNRRLDFQHQALTSKGERPRPGKPTCSTESLHGLGETNNGCTRLVGERPNWARKLLNPPMRDPEFEQALIGRS